MRRHTFVKALTCTSCSNWYPCLNRLFKIGCSRIAVSGRQVVSKYVNKVYPSTGKT